MADQECGESDQEEEGQRDKDVTQKGADEEGLKTEEEEDEESVEEEEQQENITVDEEEWYTCSEDDDEEKEMSVGLSSKSSFHNSSRLLRKDELLDLFRAVHSGPRCKEEQLTVGLVGKNPLCYTYSRHIYKVVIFWELYPRMLWCLFSP